MVMKVMNSDIIVMNSVIKCPSELYDDFKTHVGMELDQISLRGVGPAGLRRPTSEGYRSL